METNSILTVIGIVLTSNVVLAIVNAIIVAIREKRKKPSKIEAGVMWLMQDKLDYLMTKEIQRGETSKIMKKFIHKGYNFYHDLGGNGDMDRLMQAYDALEVNYGN